MSGDTESGQCAATPTLTQLADSLLAEIGDLPGTLVLVLDDYHVLKNPLADALITSLIDHLPQHLHLVISSRSEPLLPLSRWRLAGQLGELRAAIFASIRSKRVNCSACS